MTKTRYTFQLEVVVEEVGSEQEPFCATYDAVTLLREEVNNQDFDVLFDRLKLVKEEVVEDD
jgi:hypothetical protein